MIDRRVAPAIHNAIDFDFNLPKCNRYHFKNGIPVYSYNAGPQEVVMLEWVFKAGIWHEHKIAVAQAVASLLKNGTALQDSFGVHESIEFYGASLKVSANNDYTNITLHCLTKHLHHLLPLIKDIITEATFPEEEVEIYKQNALQRLAVNLRRSDFVANRNIDAALFGMKHPYGRYTQPSDISSLSRSDLQEFHQKYYSAANCIIFMAGKFTEQHETWVEQYFGNDNWGGTTIYEDDSYAKSVLAGDRTIRIKNDENGVQGSVRIAREFLTRKHPDFTPMIVLNTIFGGYFGSRLMKNIREEKGFTYGIYAQIYAYKNDGALIISSEAGEDVCEEVVKEVFKEMKLLGTEPVSNEELLLVKNYLLGSLIADLDGPFAIIQRWKSIVLSGLRETQFDQNINTYKSISPEDLLQLAQKYFTCEDFYDLVVI